MKRDNLDIFKSGFGGEPIKQPSVEEQLAAAIKEKETLERMFRMLVAAGRLDQETINQTRSLVQSLKW